MVFVSLTTRRGDGEMVGYHLPSARQAAPRYSFRGHRRRANLQTRDASKPGATVMAAPGKSQSVWKITMTNTNEREIRAIVAKTRAVYPSIPADIADHYVAKNMTAEAAGDALLRHISNNFEPQADEIYAKRKARALFNGRAS
jgi:hypothetical protein